MTPTPPTEIITLAGLRIQHAVAGTGKPIVFLHGWGAHLGLVWDLAQRFIPLGYQVHALDLPAFGASQTPASAWTVYDYAQFVLDYLDAQGLSQVYLFGHSFGGRLGIILGARHPERLLKMALADSAGVRPKTPLSARLRLGLYKRLRDTLYQLGATALADSLRARYNARYGSSDFQATDGILRQIFLQVIQEDLLPLAAQVKPSTLLFWGDQDQDTPLWQGQLLEKTMPDAGLIVYAGAGHYSYLEHSAATAHTMHHFFSHS